MVWRQVCFLVMLGGLSPSPAKFASQGVFRQKLKLGRGMDPKVVDPAQPSSQAHSFSDWPRVRVNVGQSSELGGVDQQEQACFEPDPKGKAITQPNFQVLSSSDWLPVRSDVGQSSDLEASTSSSVPPAVLRSSLRFLRIRWF
jgi:hypothetical protein